MSNETAQNALEMRKAELGKKSSAEVEQQVRESVYTLLDKPHILNSFQEMMPEGMSEKQLKQDIIVSCKNAPELLYCDPYQILGGMATFGQLGLRPGSKLGHGWLLPFAKGGKRKQVNGRWVDKDPDEIDWNCQTILGYQGTLDLTYRSKIVTNVYTEEVHANDVFRYMRGTSPGLVHEPCIDGDPGELRGFYAVALGHDGAPPWFQFATVKAMEVHRDLYAMSRTWNPKTKMRDLITGPWSTNFAAMSRKTVLIQAMKTMPKSTELGYALAADNRVRTDLTRDGLGTGWYPEPESVDGQVETPGPQAGSVDGEVMAETGAVGTLDGWLADCGLAAAGDRVAAAATIANRPGLESLAALTAQDMEYVIRVVGECRQGSADERSEALHSALDNARQDNDRAAATNGASQ